MRIVVQSAILHRTKQIQHDPDSNFAQQEICGNEGLVRKRRISFRRILVQLQAEFSGNGTRRASVQGQVSPANEVIATRCRCQVQVVQVCPATFFGARHPSVVGFGQIEPTFGLATLMARGQPYSPAVCNEMHFSGRWQGNLAIPGLKPVIV
jgi:hypothetical protein